MQQSLLITITIGLAKNFLENFIKKAAIEYKIEGTARLVSSNQIELAVCGDSQRIDDFIDLLYKNFEKYKIEDIVLEPFFRDRDYRGLFRVVSC